MRTRSDLEKKAIRRHVQEQTIKSRNKVIKPPPKEQPGDNNRNGKISYLKLGHLCWAVLSHPIVKRSCQRNVNHWLPDTSQSEVNPCGLPRTHQWNLRLPNPLSKYRRTNIVVNQRYANVTSLAPINHINDYLIFLEFFWFPIRRPALLSLGSPIWRMVDPCMLVSSRE